MQKSDVAIIGAGPAGSLAAWEIGRQTKDISVTVFEEHSQVGNPPHCSGLFSLEGFEKLGVNLKTKDSRLFYTPIKRAKFIGPKYHSVELDRGTNAMGVFDRVTVDQFFAERAQKSNCQYLLGQRIQRIHFDGTNWNLWVKTKQGISKHQTTLLISAEGAHARLAHSIGLPTPDKNWLFSAIQREFENVKDQELDCVELYFGRKYAPGFFGWWIPIEEDRARLGIAVAPWARGKTRKFMKNFLKKHPLIAKRLKNSKTTKTYGGFVSGTGPVSKTYSINYMSVGDAAGHVKATTGGGVNIGGYAGRIAGRVAMRMLHHETAQTCRDYQRLWRAEFEPDLTLMKQLRRMMTPLPDEVWNQIIHIAQETDMGKSLQTTGIDLHGLGLIKYALEPRVFIKGLKLVPQTATSFLRGLFF